MSVCGKVIPHTPLAVDFWYVRKCPGTRLFFLSHMHSDHTAGLTSTWSNRPIYCSPVTATLLRLKLQVKENWIHPLELDDPHLLPLDDIGKEKLTVTLIDANHCPGAVMFLFQGYFGSILYTGDFRYTPSMLREPCFRTNATIDVLYLDNTNCDPNRMLPSRQRATQQIKDIIRSRPNHVVVIGLYTLGKESLLVELAMEFKTWVEVSVERMETLRALELPDVFTTEPGVGRIRVVRQSEICSAAFHQWNKEQPTLAIFPTSRPLVSFHPDVFIVPYSDHSSYQELEDFVSALKPSSLVPLLGSCLPGGLAALRPSKKRHEILVPESVRNYMLREPEQQLCSSTFANLHRRHVQPLVPKGVIFDSPVRESTRSSQDAWEAECLELDAVEEEMDTESSGRDSECILVDLSQNILQNRNRRETEASWNSDNMETVSVSTATAESLPLSQLSHSSFSPIRMLTNNKASPKPAGTTLRSFDAHDKISNSSYDGRRNSQSRHSLSDGDSMSQQSSLDLNDAEKDSCASPDSFSGLRRHHLEELEISLLENLLFSEEDMNPRGLLPKNLVQQFSLIP